MLTGEPIPVSKAPGDELIGATLNASGALVMRADKIGAQTVLAQIVQMVAQAQRSRAPMQRMADVVAGYFVVGVVSIALLTLLGWGLFGPQPSWAYGLINAVAVLIIACPCALGLATPMSVMVATGKAASHGVLFRDAAAIETLRQVDTLIVDKTGTLTEGKPAFHGLAAAAGWREDEVLRTRREPRPGQRASTGPGHRRRGASARTQARHAPEDFESASGIGVRGAVDGQSRGARQHGADGRRRRRLAPAGGAGRSACVQEGASVMFCRRRRQDRRSARGLRPDQGLHPGGAGKPARQRPMPSSWPPATA